MADDPSLRIFPDEYVPNVEGSAYHSKWVSANKNGDAPKWVAFRDALLAGQTPVVPAMATKYGKALVAAGKEHMSISHFVGQVTNPYPPPDPVPTPPSVVFTTNITDGQTLATPYQWTASTTPIADSMEFWADGALVLHDTAGPFQHTLVLADGLRNLGLGAYHAGVRTLYDPNNLGRFAQITVANGGGGSGTERLIQTFADVVSTNWGQPFVNRWYTTGNAYQPPPNSGNWPSISAEAIEQITTAHGPGFRFRVHTEMDAFSAGAKAVMLHDQNHYISQSNFLGKTQEIQFKIMFPSSGNVTPWYNPAYDDFNALMEMVGDSNVSNQIGINASGRFYCRSYGHIQSGKALGPTIALDTWYTHRWIKKWAYDSTGLTQWYVDGVKYADWTGASLEPGTNINSFQWGYYSFPPPTLTEIHYAGMKFIDY